MNDMFSKIDSIDLTSIITEQSEEAIQSELNTIYEGSWESNSKQNDNDLLIESIIKEISDSLAITNIKLNKKIVESSISRVYPRFSNSLYKKVVRKLEESGFDISKLKENDIEDAQKEISDLKQQEEAIDKVEDIKTEKDEDEPSKSSINSKLTKAYAKLKSATSDKNDDLDNAFGEEKLTEEGESFEGTKADIMKKFPELASNPNYECYADDDWMAVDFNEDGSIKGIRLANKVEESIAVNATVDNVDQESKDKATIDKAIELAGDKTTIDNDTFRELRLKLANKDYDLVDRTSDYALVRGEDVIYTWTRKEDENLKESENLNEWVDPTPEVKIKDFYAGTENGEQDYQFDNINPNITFQELYDNISKHSITSLIGDVDSDVRNKIINAMCDAFDIDDAYSIEISDDLPPYEGMNESVHVNVSGGNVDVSTDNTNLSIDGDNVDVHVEDGDTLAPSVEITEPVIDEIPVDSLDASAEEIIDEPVEEPIEEPVEEPTEEVLDEPNNLLDDSEKRHNNKCLSEKSWKQLESGSELRKAINSCDEDSIDDLKNVLDKLKKCCEDAKGMCDGEDADYHQNGFQSVIDDIETIYDDEELDMTNIDYELDGFYDWCDAANIFVSLDEDASFQVDDVPAKVDHKRIELAKMESEDSVTYRVSYLKEDDEVCGWDLDCDNDEDAINSLDQFQNAGQVADDLLTAEFIETGIDGISSFNYNNTDILLSTDGDNNIITINQDNAEPVVMKGDSFDEVLNQLIYWFIMNTDCPDCEAEPAEDLDNEVEIDKENENE